MPGKSLDHESVIPAAEWMPALKPLLDEGHELKLRPVGSSMAPFLVGGRDEVFLRSPKMKKPARGDIALFSRDDGLFVLHRIHHIRKDRYYMLGDAQTQIEGPVRADSIQAVAAAVIWKNKKISCSNPGLRFITGVWLLLRPVRPLLFRLYGGLKRLLKHKDIAAA